MSALGQKADIHIAKGHVRLPPIATSIASKSDLGNPVIETGELGRSVLLSLLALAVPLSPSFSR